MFVVSVEIKSLFPGSLWRLIAVLVSVVWCACSPSPQVAVKKPNIVLFIADDHSTIDSGCYGNPVVRTPHIDRLAKEGMRFTRAFTTEAICGPSRATLYTGLYPWRHGGYRQHSSIRQGVKTLPQYLKDLQYLVALDGKVDCKPDSAFPFEYLREGKYDEFLQRAGDKPFCLIVASHLPHRPFNEEWSGTHDPARVKIPPYLVDTPETREDFTRYYGMVEREDSEVGALVDALRKRSVLDNTILIFTSDQGQSYPFAKWTCYDAGLSVPLIVRWPGHIRAGSVSSALVSFIDVLPTFLELAGGNPISTLDGRSLVPLLEGRTDVIHDCIFGTYTHVTVGHSQGDFPIRSARTLTHAYIRNIAPERTFTCNITAGGEDIQFWQSWLKKAKTDAFAAERVQLYQHRPAEELYDMQTDPWQLKNVIKDPAQKEALEAIGAKLDTWIKQQGDPCKVDDEFKNADRTKQDNPL